jgi:uncharacterized protein (DUF433 family)
MHYQQYIERNPKVMQGKPIIKDKEQLGWSVVYNIEALVKDMVDGDYNNLKT